MKYSIPETFQMAHNLMKAHGQAVINLRKYAKQKIRVGYAPTCGVAYPATESADDIAAAKKVYFGFENPMDNWTWNVAWFSDPVFLGEYPKEGLEKFADYLPEITEEDMQLIHQPLDFVGQNIYNGYMIRCGADGDPEYVDRAPGTAKTGTGWPVTPEALYYGIRFLTERYRLPLYITENGMSDLDNISADGQVHDRERITFLDAYLGAVQRAINEGMPVIGYFLWTFLDNFEWAEGYKERFGLVYVDYTTQRRIAKDSAYWYREVMRMNGENLKDPPRCTRSKIRIQKRNPLSVVHLSVCGNIVKIRHPVFRNIKRQSVTLGKETDAIVKCLRCHRPAGSCLCCARCTVHILRVSIRSTADHVTVVNILSHEIKWLMNQLHVFFGNLRKIVCKLLQPLFRILS